MTTRRDFHRSVLCLAAASLASPARADDAFPSRPVRIIVPFAAGGGPDVLTRKLAVKLAAALGHDANVIVENMVGAGGIVAGQNVVRMAPDGYNLLLGASSFVVQKLMEPDVKFDPVKDFAHVTRTSYSSSVLVVRADAPYRTIEDLVAAARREPGKLNYASGGVGSAAHLCGAALALTAKIDVVHVPYKGSVEIVPSILMGSTQYAFPIASTAIPQIRAGKVRALAVTSVERMKALPDVPTLVETFHTPDLALDAWFGLWAPAGTPKAIVDTLFAATGKAYADPGLRADTESVGGLVALSQSPAEFTQFIEAETVKFRTLVKAAHLTA